MKKFVSPDRQVRTSPNVHSVQCNKEYHLEVEFEITTIFLSATPKTSDIFQSLNPSLQNTAEIKRRHIQTQATQMSYNPHEN